MLSKLEWHTEQRKVDSLIPWQKNPRQMTEKQAKDLQTSLEHLNLISIPAIDTDNTIVSGHQRMKIMQLLGRGEEVIDVRVPNRKLTENELKEANLRENKNTGEWDFDLLAEFNTDMLLDVGWDRNEVKDIIDLSMIGFSEPSEKKISLGEKKSVEVKPVFYVDQIEVLEKAILETGEQNRNKAFMKICEFYLENNKKK